MTVDIVGTGATSQNWKQHDYSIGVNDAWKFGQPTDALLVCNRPQQFTPNRIEIIINSKPKDFFSHKANWAEWFPKWKQINLVTWYGTLNPKQVYNSDTSPFIAISLAYNLGAKEIILWGVDFISHHIYNTGNTDTKNEVERYLQLFEALKERGVNVFVGSEGGVFERHLSVYS
jgi:hypothetical protein